MKYGDLLNKYKKLTACNSIMNEMGTKLLFHSVLGAYFKRKIIRWGVTNKDVRVHPLWLQDSRTGKDQALKVAKDIAENLNLRVVMLTDITDPSALIGSYSPEIHQLNEKNGVSREEPIREKRDGSTVEFQDPIIYGDLYYNDIIMFSESKLLFQMNQNSQKLLTNLQPALDYPGFVYKKMKYEEPITFYCDTTLMMVSIPFKEMKK
ncbi:MAG: hypothetical protein ACOCUI_03815, partial [bacterium]